MIDDSKIIYNQSSLIKFMTRKHKQKPIKKLLCVIGLHDWRMGGYTSWKCKHCGKEKFEHYY